MQPLHGREAESSGKIVTIQEHSPSEAGRCPSKPAPQLALPYRAAVEGWRCDTAPVGVAPWLLGAVASRQPPPRAL
jgi:hypothetical protein